MKAIQLRPRDLAFCGVFGATALLLPTVFHLIRLGHVFMPMYIPLVFLAFFVRPSSAAITALIVPILSGGITGMPPFYPPIAFLMSAELAVMAALISWLYRCKSNMNEWVVLVPVLLFGRVLYVIMVYLLSKAISLPAGFVAGVSLLGGWPGIILMIAILPPLVRWAKRLPLLWVTEKEEN